MSNNQTDSNPSEDHLVSITSLSSISISQYESHVPNSDSLSERRAYDLINVLRRFTKYNLKKEFVYRDTLEELLEANDFHFRPSRISRDVNSSQQLVFIAVIPGSSDILICRAAANRHFCYSTLTQRYHYRKLDHDIPDCAIYEVLPLLPSEIDRFSTLISFVFPAIRDDLIIALALSLVLTIISLATPFLTSHVISDVIPSGDLAFIISTFVFSVVLSLYSGLIAWIQSYYLLRLNQKLSLRIQIPIFKRILSLPVQFLDRYSTGDLTLRATAIGDVLSALSSTTLSSIISCISLFGYLGLMLYYDFYLSIPVLAYTLFVAIVQTLIARRQFRYQSQYIDELGSSYDNILDVLKNITRTRTSGSEISALSRLSSFIYRTTSLDYRVNALAGANKIISEIFLTVGSSLVYAVIVFRIFTASSLVGALSTTAMFIVFMSAFQSFSSSLLGLTDLFNNLLALATVQVRKALPLLLEPTEDSFSRASIRQPLVGEIEFRSVSFTYPGSDKPILDKLSFRIIPHKFNVIFGPSGCGKSTIASLILGFYRPTSGTIYVDGVDLSELNLRHYRTQIGSILQTPQLTTSSIREAVSSGLVIDDAIIWSALEKVNLVSEIEALPMKLETVLCEGSANISGGQRQRLCIARALLRNPSMLLEDESTSALDNFSQQVITHNLSKLSVTRVVIAHRLSAIRNCDNLLVIKDGRLETSGSFDYCSTHSPFLSSVLKIC